MKEKLIFSFDEPTPIRLDKYLFLNCDNKSRSYIQKLIEDGCVFVNEERVKKSSTVLRGKSKIILITPKEKKLDLEPKKIPLDILYEDKNILVINKAPGIMVHPTLKGKEKESIVHAVLFHCKKSLSGISGVLRPGIIHRLDKDTSGVLIIAKNDESHKYISTLFQKREVKKIYLALVKGNLPENIGTIEAPIARSRSDRKKMGISARNGKIAITHFSVKKRYENSTLLEVQIVTGRTHQIRVHFASIGYPIAGDNIYGDKKWNNELLKEYGLKRQFLHAQSITLKLKDEKKERSFLAPLFHDLQSVIESLK